MTPGVHQLPSLVQVGFSPLKNGLFKVGRMCLTCIATGKCLPLAVREMLFCEIGPELPACCD